MNRRTFVAGITSVTTALAGCASRVTEFGTTSRSGSRTYDVDAGTNLRVRNRNGSVTVERHDGDDVALDFEVEGPSDDAVDAVSVTGVRDGGGLRLRTESERSSAGQDVSVTMTVGYPETAFVERVATHNGSIDVEVVAIDDDAAIESTNGSIDAALVPDLDAAVTATTDNGSVNLHDLDLAAATNSDADVSGTLGDGTNALALRTNNGSIDLRALSD